MAKYEIKFSCGHTETIQLYGKMKDRQRKIEYFEREGLCSECYKKAIEQEKQDLEKKADAYIRSIGGVAELEGSPKQIAWAEKIRKQIIGQAVEYKEDISEKLENNFGLIKLGIKSAEQFDNIIAYNFATITSSNFYIDCRFDGFDYDVLKYFVMNMKKAEKFQEEVIQDEDEKNAKEESALKPAETKHDGIVEVTAKDNCVEVRYHNDEDFKAVVKGLKFRWNRDKMCWRKEKGVMTASTIDMAAEVINKLLHAGFIVFTLDDNAKQKAVSGDFEQTTDRWICQTGDTLAIHFDRNDELYQRAMAIHGAKYRNRSVRVPVEEYREVLDFANAFNFRLSAGAKEMIDNYKNKLDNAETVVPVDVKKSEDKGFQIPESEDLSDLIDD